MEIGVWGTSVLAAMGYAYYKFIGCRTDACPLTSNPWISTIYGAFVGGLLAG